MSSHCDSVVTTWLFPHAGGAALKRSKKKKEREKAWNNFNISMLKVEFF